jgi:quinol monooxygenase YgiN
MNGKFQEHRTVTIRKTACFTVDPDRLSDAIKAIGILVANTKREPSTLLYQSWQSSERPTEFLHFMVFADGDAEIAHASSDAAKAFTNVLYPLCVETPRFEYRNSVS